MALSAFWLNYASIMQKTTRTSGTVIFGLLEQRRLVLEIKLPFPQKTLWPNGGSNHNVYKVAKLKKSHRRDAFFATVERLRHGDGFDQPIAMVITVHPKPRGPEPDKDNCIAVFKHYQDGISDALKVNDREFQEPKIVFGERRPFGAFVVTL